MGKYYPPHSGVNPQRPAASTPNPPPETRPVAAGYSGDGLWKGYLEGGYFDAAGALRVEFVDRAHMEPMARAMADGKLSSTQIRRFFSHCRAIEGRLKSGGSTWAVEATSFARTDVFAADALAKGKAPRNFHDFIRRNVATVKTCDDFLMGFMPHFEALVGFGTAHFAKSERN